MGTELDRFYGDHFLGIVVVLRATFVFRGHTVEDTLAYFGFEIHLLDLVDLGMMLRFGVLVCRHFGTDVVVGGKGQVT